MIQVHVAHSFSHVFSSCLEIMILLKNMRNISLNIIDFLLLLHDLKVFASFIKLTPIFNLPKFRKRNQVSRIRIAVLLVVALDHLMEVPH